MQVRMFIGSVIGAMGMLALLGAPLEAQVGRELPGNDIVRPRGQGVAPVFEGFYENPDGDGYIISFGYMNRNGEEIVDLPVGASNHIEPERFDGMQPTHFLPRRWWGVFAVEVPEDFGRNDVTWTIDFRGETYEIPGRITNNNYLIDALYAPATGLTPPALAFERSGEEGRGPLGIHSEPRTATVGEPLDLVAWTEDDTWENPLGGEGDESEGGEDRRHDVTLRWYKYSGPAGEVSFNPQEITLEPQSGTARAATTATFAEPGEYVLYVRADNENMRAAGLEQCCWTNGYVQVTVSP